MVHMLIWRSWSSPSCMWVLGTELKSSGLVISVFTSSAILQARNIFISGVLTGKFPVCFVIFGNIVIYLPLKKLDVLKLGGKGKMPVKL